MPANNKPPNFLVIGAAKSGTTTLFDLLIQHPEVYQPFAKEIKYFNNDRNYAKGMEWYQNTCFKDSSNYPARGEATPHYLFWGEKVTSRILETLGKDEVKFITIFRDPVQRAYSQYWMGVHRENEALSFEDALAAEEQRLDTLRQTLEPIGTLKYAYYRGGCYASLLQPYLQLFPRTHFHFLLSEDLMADIKGAMQKVAEFLGIRPDFAFSPVASNSSYTPRNYRLFRFLESPSGPIYHLLRKTAHLLPESKRYRLRHGVVLANRKPTTYPPIHPETERALRARYRQEVIDLEEIMGRDLSHWYRETA